MTLVSTVVAVLGAIVAVVLSLPLLVLGLPLLFVAALTNALRRTFEPAAMPWQDIIEFDETVGWKPRPHLDAHCRFAPGFFHLRTDAHGWRGASTLAEADMVVIGDSFAFGYGVDDRDAYFSLLGRDVRVKAIASPGYSMVQEVIWMRQLAPLFKGKPIVWFICFGNDLYDNLSPNLYQYRIPFVRQANGSDRWEIVNGHLDRTAWPCEYWHPFRAKDKLAAVFGTNRGAVRLYSACEFLITTARDLCRDAGSPLTIVTIPWHFQFDVGEWQSRMKPLGEAESFDIQMPDRKLREICERLGVRQVSAREHTEITDYIPDDGHWTRSGHRRVAALLARLYREHSRVVPEPAAYGAMTRRSPSVVSP